MKANFGRRILLWAALLSVAAFMLIISGVAWWHARACARVSLGYEYFLLVRPCEEATSAAVIGESYSAGGAALAYGADGVAIACYFSRSEAERVQERMRAEGTETELVRIAPAEFFLYGSAAENRALAEANAATADSIARMLYDVANGLERSEIGQREAAASLKGAAASLKGLREGNGAMFSDWNAALYRAEEAARESGAEIVFAKDVRRIQTMLCMSVAAAGEYM